MQRQPSHGLVEEEQFNGAQWRRRISLRRSGTAEQHLCFWLRLRWSTRWRTGRRLRDLFRTVLRRIDRGQRGGQSFSARELLCRANCLRHSFGLGWSRRQARRCCRDLFRTVLCHRCSQQGTGRGLLAYCGASRANCLRHSFLRGGRRHHRGYVCAIQTGHLDQVPSATVTGHDRRCFMSRRLSGGWHGLGLAISVGLRPTCGLLTELGVFAPPFYRLMARDTRPHKKQDIAAPLEQIRKQFLLRSGPSAKVSANGPRISRFFGACSQFPGDLQKLPLRRVPGCRDKSRSHATLEGSPLL